MNGVGAPPSSNLQPFAHRSCILAVQHRPPPDQLRAHYLPLGDVRKRFSIHFLTLVKEPSFNQYAGCCVYIHRVFLRESRTSGKKNLGALEQSTSEVRTLPDSFFHVGTANATYFTICFQNPRRLLRGPRLRIALCHHFVLVASCPLLLMSLSGTLIRGWGSGPRKVIAKT